MLPEERLNAAINLGEPDRVPVSPIINCVAARWVGISQREFLQDTEKGMAALDAAYRLLGGCDANWNLYSSQTARSLKVLGPLRVHLPGEGIPEDSVFQYQEVEVMKPEEYPLLIQSFPEFNKVYLSRIHPGVDAQAIRETALWRTELHRQDVARWAQRGIPSMVAAVLSVPFDLLCFMRSWDKFFLDLYRIPDTVVAALEAVAASILSAAQRAVAQTGVRRVFLGGTRCAATFISPKMFDRFVMPTLRKLVEGLFAQGIVSLLHFDSDWTLHLPLLAELPRGSCILDLDGTTDIFEAKRRLQGRLCIMGDVPATLLTLGTPQEVQDYCKRLIDGVGAGGGFILSSGCDVPIDAKLENVRAMVDTAKTYGIYKV